MKTKKFLSVSVLCLLLTVSSATAAYASEETMTSEIIAKQSSELDQYGEIINVGDLYAADNRIQMYVEFSDRDTSFTNFYEKYETVFIELKNNYELGNPTSKNFDTYFNRFLDSLSLESTSYKDDYDIEQAFRLFYDIYENTDINREIKEKVDSINLTTKNNSKRMRVLSAKPLQDDAMFELAMLIPNYNELAVQANEVVLASTTPLAELPAENGSGMMTPMGLSGTPLTKAVNYATAHATSRNSNYQSFSADCTNFTSQILEAAGVSQVRYASEHSGWWHYRVWEEMGTSGGGKWWHYHSVSWIRADTFARYMGVGKKAYNIRQLGDMVVKGDFVAADWYGDGSWDHNAFVTAADNYYGTYKHADGTSYYYRDFKVAQHTKDYNRWVSNTDNEWEVFSGGKVVALVRR